MLLAFISLQPPIHNLSRIKDFIFSLIFSIMLFLYLFHDVNYIAEVIELNVIFFD